MEGLCMRRRLNRNGRKREKKGRDTGKWGREKRERKEGRRKEGET